MHAEDIKLKHLVPCLLGKTAKPNILCERSSQIDGLVALWMSLGFSAPYLAHNGST